MIQTRLQRLVESFAQTKSSWDNIFLKGLELPDAGTREIFEKPYTKSGLVYVCISTTARAISQAPIIVMQKVGKSKKERHGYFYHLSDKFKVLSSNSKKDYIWEPVPENNPWQKLFDSPNPILESRLFIESIIGYWLLDGNVWIYGFPIAGKIPQGLWIIRLNNMEKDIDNRTGQLLKWNYKPRGEVSIPLDPWKDCLAQIKFWNPDDPYIGQKPLKAGKMELQSDYKAAKYNENFFDEGAQFGGIISSESKIDKTVQERLEQEVRSRHEGYTKAHRFMILQGGLKFEQVGVTQKDMEFLDLRKYSRETLLQIFGMKKAIISVTDDLNYATAMEQKRDWWESTLIPLMNGITSSLDSGLLKNDPNLWITFDLSGIQALKEDLQKKVDVASKLWSIGFTANEINEKLELGFDAQPWRDKWYAPMNLIPVNGGSQEESTPIISEIVDKTKQIPYEGQLIEKKIDIQDHINLIHEANWKSFITSITPLENILDAKVRNVFYRMRKKALKLLYQKSITDIGAEEFADEQKLIESYSRPVFEDAVKAGGNSVLSELGIVGSFDLLDPGIIAFLQIKPLKIKGTVDTVKKQIREQLQKGTELGESIDKIADRIRGVFNVANGRARTIARTEIVGASNFGRHSQMMTSNVKMKEWFTALDERVRQDHVAMHGTRIKIDELFLMPDGSMLKYPGDWTGAPAQIINCRCISVAVIEEITKEEEGVEFKSKENQLLYDKYLTQYGEWELSDFKENFIKEVGSDIKQSLHTWQTTVRAPSTLGFKYKTYLMEKKIKICRVLHGESVESIREAARKITDESYIKLRALTQAYYKKKGSDYVTLYKIGRAHV